MMRGLTWIAGLAVLVALYGTGYGQEQKGPPGGAPPQPPREGRPPGPGAGGAPQDLREKLDQLRNVEQRLHEEEAKALEANPELQATRQQIQDEFEALIEKVRALEQKVDDAVVKASPDAEQLVKEKRQVLAEIEDQAGPRKSMLWMFRLRSFFGGPGPGQGGAGPRGGPGRPGRAPGGAPAPPAQPK